MADKDTPKATATPAPGPKSVHIGGESLADRILPHMKKIIVVLLLAVVLASAILLVRWRKGVKQEAETAKLAEVLTLARKPVGPAPFDPSNPTAVLKDDDNFKTPADRATAVLDAITKQGTDGGTPAFKAGLLLDAGKIDEAIAAYTAGSSAKGIDGILAREGLGIAYETKANAEKDPAARQKLLEQALAAFTEMQPDEAGARRAYALYHQGRIQLALGKKADAKASFEKAKELGSATELPELIERRLAAM